MKRTILVLYLLLASSVRKEEACGSKNSKPEKQLDLEVSKVIERTVDDDSQRGRREQLTEEQKAEQAKEMLAKWEAGREAEEQNQRIDGGIPRDTDAQQEPAVENIPSHQQEQEDEPKQQNEHNNIELEDEHDYEPFDEHYLDDFDILDEATAVDELPDELTCHLLIIGGGPQMVAFLAHMVQVLPNEKFSSMIIVEKNSKMAVGSPYSTDRQDKDNLLHVHTLSGVSTDPKSKEFLDWLVNEKHYYRVNDVKKFKAEPPPRIVFGEYIGERFEDIEHDLKGLNYQITKIPRTSADTIASDGDKGFVVTLSNEKTVTAHDVLLATGHWDWYRFGDHVVKGYYKSPYPVTDLTDPDNGIPTNVVVAILGLGLGGIDAAMTMANHNGNFTPQGDDYQFLYETDHNSFKIIMYSRTGHFPAVSSQNDPDVKFEHMNLTEFDTIRKKSENKGFLPLKEVLTRLKKDIIKIHPKFDELRGFWEMGFKEFFTAVDQFMYPQDTAQERLLTDIKRARKFEIFPFQTFFSQVRSYFNRIARYFLAEDYIIFKKDIQPTLTRLAAPMALINAEKLLALMEARRLEVVPVGEGGCEPRRNSDNAGVWLHCGGQNKYHPYFIEALGQSGDMDKDPSTLTASLFENKLAQKLHIPYKDQNKAYKADGIEMDIDSMRVIPPGETIESIAEKDGSVPAIYATGPFVYGRYPSAESLAADIIFGANIAANIWKRYDMLE